MYRNLVETSNDLILVTDTAGNYVQVSPSSMAIIGYEPAEMIGHSAVEFIDSSGLGALISGLKTARTAGGDLRLAAATEQVTSVLQLTNLDRILRVYPSPDDAYRD